jgi:hypothetical protein
VTGLSIIGIVALPEHRPEEGGLQMGIVLSILVILDGVEDPGRGADFEHGVWQCRSATGS